MDECYYECVAARYAAALHPDVQDDLGGVVGVAHGSTSLSLRFPGQPSEVLAPYVVRLGNLEGRRTIATRGRTLRMGVEAWDKIARARLHDWLHNVGIRPRHAPPVHAIVEQNRAVVAISGTWFAGVAALGVSSSPSRRTTAGAAVEQLRVARAALLEKGGLGDASDVDPSEHAELILDLSNLTLVAHVFEMLLNPATPVGASARVPSRVAAISAE